MTTRYPVPDTVFVQHSAWLATSGAGKTTAVKGAVERMLARGERVVVIDPTGVWWGLRFRRDGRRASPYEIAIFGREHADMPLDAGSGEAIARALATSSTSAILSLKGMRVAERTRFVTDLFETLAAENRGLLNLVIDEVHLFAPQSGGTGLTPAMLHATNNLVSTGRAAGLRVAMISQRPAKVHKDSLTQASTLVALRCAHPLDQRPIRDWLSTTVPDKDRRAEIMASLAALPTGAGWLSAPQQGVLERVAFPMIETFDSSRPGVEEIPLKPLDVDALRKALAAAAPAQSEAGVASKRPASEPGAIAERRASGEELAAAEQRGYARGLQDGEARGLRRGAEAGWRTCATLFERDINVISREFAAAPDGHEDGVAEIAKALGLAAWPKAAAEQAPAPAGQPGSRAPAPAAAGPSGHASRAAAAPAKPSDAVALTGPQRQMLKAIAFWAAMGHPAPRRAQVAAIAGWRITSGHLKNVAGSLSSAGLITYPSPGLLTLTEAGAAAAPAPDLAASLLDSLFATLTGPQRAAVEVLLAAKARQLSRADLAADCGWEPTSGHVKNVVGSLSSLEIVEYPQPGIVALQDWVR